MQIFRETITAIVDKKIRGLLYQLENPEFKAKAHLLTPVAGTYKEWLSISLSQEDLIRNLLNTRQDGIKQKQWANYTALKSNEVFKQILSYWSNEKSMFREDLEIATWEGSNKYGDKTLNYGMRVKSTGVPHGIVRQIDQSSGSFKDSSFNEGV